MIKILAESHNHETMTFCRMVRNSSIVQPYGYTVEVGTFDNSGRERTTLHTLPMHGLTRDQAHTQFQMSVQGALDNARLKAA